MGRVPVPEVRAGQEVPQLNPSWQKSGIVQEPSNLFPRHYIIIIQNRHKNNAQLSRYCTSNRLTH